MLGTAGLASLDACPDRVMPSPYPHKGKKFAREQAKLERRQKKEQRRRELLNERLRRLEDMPLKGKR